MKIPKILVQPYVLAIGTIVITLLLIFKGVTPWKINLFLLIMFLIYLLIVNYSQFFSKD